MGRESRHVPGELLQGMGGWGCRCPKAELGVTGPGSPRPSGPGAPVLGWSHHVHRCPSAHTPWIPHAPLSVPPSLYPLSPCPPGHPGQRKVKKDTRAVPRAGCSVSGSGT